MTEYCAGCAYLDWGLDGFRLYCRHYETIMNWRWYDAVPGCQLRSQTRLMSILDFMIEMDHEI